MKSKQTKIFLDDLVLSEEYIQAFVERWRNINFDVLIIEMISRVLNKPATRDNIIEWLEKNLRAKNALVAKRIVKKNIPE